MTYSELKQICNKLENNNVYYRHPKSSFVKVLGEDTVQKLSKIKFLKDSPHIENVHDYNEDCFAYSSIFKLIFNFITTPFWLWIKIYVFQYYAVRRYWQKLRIKFGHHYTWQDYIESDLDEI